MNNINVFSRGDFDEYKISDEELKELDKEILEIIEKSNPYPRQKGGLWGHKPDLITKNHLTKTAKKKDIDIETLKVCKLKDFEKQVDFLYSNNYQMLADVIRLPNINKRLAKQIGLGSIKCFYTKKQMIHSSPQRKATYNQDLRIDEFKRIPIIIHNSNLLYYDKKNKNFFIPFMDRNDKKKVNKIVFYKDVSGNYAVTASKVYLSSLKDKDLVKVGVGVAPTIHKSIPRSSPTTRLSVSPTYNKSIPQPQKKSSKITQRYSKNTLQKALNLTDEQYESYLFSTSGDKKHTNFAVEITDITEKNKGQKIEQLQNVLKAIYNNTPFYIQHIEADGEKTLNNIKLEITDFSQEKIEKAINTTSLMINTAIPLKGEKFSYTAQKDLVQRFSDIAVNNAFNLYDFICDYFDLPKITILTKADMRWKGKLIYSPETGKPISTDDWKKFVEALEKFLNRNYNGIGNKIVLSAEVLGRILDRMTKYQSLPKITSTPLTGIKYGGKSYDWISDSVKNMKNIFGEEITRTQAARIQIMQQSATQRITKATDKQKNQIQQILIDGCKNKKSKSQVSQDLFRACASLNTDIQRIADTEIQESMNRAYLAEEVYNSPENEPVYFMRHEIIDDNTCTKCEKLNGKIAIWSEYPLENERVKDKYATYAIWDGKTDGDAPVGVKHPYCRGLWVRWFPMDKEIEDAWSAKSKKLNDDWDKAVEQATKEFEAKGIKNPTDKTKGFTERIREIFNELSS